MFCEKPLAANLDDARAATNAVRDAAVQIGYPHRFDPASARCGRRVNSAALLLTLDDGKLGLISNSRYDARGYDVCQRRLKIDR